MCGVSRVDSFSLMYLPLSTWFSELIQDANLRHYHSHFHTVFTLGQGIVLLLRVFLPGRGISDARSSVTHHPQCVISCSY